MIDEQIVIELPKLHAGQQKIVDQMQRFTVLQCGRRFGKSTLAVRCAAEMLNYDKPVGWFGPTFKHIAPQFELLQGILNEPFAKTNKAAWSIVKKGALAKSSNELIGRIDFWSCERPDPGRGRKYAMVIIDEASLIRNFGTVWQAAIKPTLTDLRGNALFLGTPKGQSGFFNVIFKRGERRHRNWISFRMGSIDNPYIEPEEIFDAKKELPEDIFKQEYEGIPCDDGGNPFGLNEINICYDPELFIEDTKVVAFGVDLASKYDYTWVIGCNKVGQVVVSERFQLDWPSTKKKIGELCRNVPTLVDATGVGDPIVEDLQSAFGSNFEGFKFSNSSKQQIMIGLRNDIQSKDISFSDPNLKAELDAFSFEFRNGRVFYSAPEGLHDDGVCALALCRQHVRVGPAFRAIEPGEMAVAAARTQY